MGLNLKALIGKLNEPARLALEGAAGLCLSRTNYDVEVEHYLTKLLESTSGAFAAILKHFEIDKSRLSADLARSLDKLKSGNARTPAISPTVLKMLTNAWTIGSIDFSAGQVRTGFTIIALVSDDELMRLVNDVSREFQKINADALRKDLLGIVAMSSETTTVAATGAAPGDPAAKPAGGRTIPSSPERRVWARPQWSKALPCGSPRVMCLRRSRMCMCGPSTWRCCRRAQGSRESLRTGSRDSLTK